jgi:hypothetical protein
MKVADFVPFLVVLALLLTAIGGSLDILKKDEFMGLSKYHYWNDGVFVLLLAILAAVA